MKLIPWWMQVAAVVGLVAALWAGAEYAIHRFEMRGYNRAVAERKESDDALLKAATANARKAEAVLQDQLYTAALDREKDALRHEKDLATLRAAARSGTERLRCPAIVHANPAPDDSTAAARPGNEARSGDLVPGTTDDLFRIAASIAAGVQRENALIDTYNAARATCNKELP